MIDHEGQNVKASEGDPKVAPFREESEHLVKIMLSLVINSIDNRLLKSLLNCLKNSCVVDVSCDIFNCFREVL